MLDDLDRRIDVDVQARSHREVQQRHARDQRGRRVHHPEGADGRQPARRHAAPTSHVNAVDPETVEFHLKAANAAFLAIISAKYIVPAAYYQSGRTQMDSLRRLSDPGRSSSTRLSGGGAVVLGSPTFTLVKKQQYSKITFTPVPSAQSQIAGLQAEDAGTWSRTSRPTRWTSSRADSNISIDETDSSGGVSFIAFNTAEAPMSSLSFRMAVSEAIDRASMVKTIMNGHAQVATGLFTPSVLDYDTTRKPPVYDLTQAKKDLAASGYTGTTIDLTYPTSVLVNADLVAQAISAYLATLASR